MATIQDSMRAKGGLPIGTQAKGSTQSFQVIHELNSLDGDSLQVHELIVKPSIESTVIKLYSAVDTSSVRKGESDVYLASVRRRKCRELSAMFLQLKGQAAQDLLFETQPILKEVNVLINSLQRCAKEADTREILRQVRDTLRNGQWESYKSEACRKVASDALNTLANAIVADVQMVAAITENFEAQGFTVSGFIPQDI